MELTGLVLLTVGSSEHSHLLRNLEVNPFHKPSWALEPSTSGPACLQLYSSFLYSQWACLQKPDSTVLLAHRRRQMQFPTLCTLGSQMPVLEAWLEVPDTFWWPTWLPVWRHSSLPGGQWAKGWSAATPGVLAEVRQAVTCPVSGSPGSCGRGSMQWLLSEVCIIFPSEMASNKTYFSSIWHEPCFEFSPKSWLWKSGDFGAFSSTMCLSCISVLQSKGWNNYREITLARCKNIRYTQSRSYLKILRYMSMKQQINSVT